MCSLPTISPSSWWTGQLMAQVPTASTCTCTARRPISCAAARMDSGGTLSTIIKGRQCESPPDIYAPRQLSAMEPLFSANPNTRYETAQWVMVRWAESGRCSAESASKFAGKAVEDKHPSDRYATESARLLGVSPAAPSCAAATYPDAVQNDRRRRLEDLLP